MGYSGVKISNDGKYFDLYNDGKVVERYELSEGWSKSTAKEVKPMEGIFFNGDNNKMYIVCDGKIHEYKLPMERIEYTFGQLIWERVKCFLFMKDFKDLNVDIFGAHMVEITDLEGEK